MQRQNDDIEAALRWEELEIGEFAEKLVGSAGHLSFLVTYGNYVGIRRVYLTVIFNGTRDVGIDVCEV
jgi:hypothetical protein